MKYPKDPDQSYLGLQGGDLERGYSDASSPDGTTRSNNDGLRTAYEDSLENDVDSQYAYSRRDDGADAIGLIDRPGLNYRSMVRRN